MFIVLPTTINLYKWWLGQIVRKGKFKFNVSYKSVKNMIQQEEYYEDPPLKSPPTNSYLASREAILFAVTSIFDQSQYLIVYLAP